MAFRCDPLNWKSGAPPGPELMGDNLQWLFGAFGAGWIIHMLYLLSISRRQKKVLRQIEDIQKLFPDEGSAERK